MPTRMLRVFKKENKKQASAIRVEAPPKDTEIGLFVFYFDISPGKEIK